MNRGRAGGGDRWVCLACELQWDRARLETECCPQCGCRGVIGAFLPGGC